MMDQNQVALDWAILTADGAVKALLRKTQLNLKLNHRLARLWVLVRTISIRMDQK
jgi:hypothetical protein